MYCPCICCHRSCSDCGTEQSLPRSCASWAASSNRSPIASGVCRWKTQHWFQHWFLGNILITSNLSSPLILNRCTITALEYIVCPPYFICTNDLRRNHTITDTRFYHQSQRISCAENPNSLRLPISLRLRHPPKRPPTHQANRQSQPAPDCPQHRPSAGSSSAASL